MRDRELVLYLSEISRQGAFASIAHDALQTALGGLSPGSTLKVFAGAQGMLTAAAQISKLLWADIDPKWSTARTRAARHRANTLREIIQPDPILQRRRVRNAVEHFDERLDAVLFETPDANILDGNVLPKGAIQIEGARWMRNLDPQTLVYSALDDDVDLTHLLGAIHTAAAAADLWIDVNTTQ